MDPALERFIDLVKKRFGDKFVSVILFGSAARGESGEFSDVDLLIIAKEAFDVGRERLEVLRSFGVDLDVVVTDLKSFESSPLFFGVLLGYKVLYGSDVVSGIVKKKGKGLEDWLIVSGEREWKVAEIL